VPYLPPHTRPSQIGRRSQIEYTKVLKVPTHEPPEEAAWHIIQPGAVTRAPAKLRNIPAAYDWWLQWPKFGALVMFNTSYSPHPPAPEYEPTYICEDGLWGRRDFSTEPHFFDHLSPHLALLPVPQIAEDFDHILFRLPTKRECVNLKPGFVLARDLRDYIASLLGSISDVAHKAKRWIERITRENPHLSEPGKESTRVRLVLEGRFPSSVEANMFELLKLLSGTGVHSENDLILVWVAMQRCARELIAYASFCSHFVQSTAARQALENVLLLDSMLGSLPRRGSIFTGSDLKYIDVFIGLNLPAYAYIWRKEYFVDPDRMIATTDTRTSIVVCESLSTSFKIFIARHAYLVSRRRCC
jgi:hypothetical protein